MKIYTGKLHSVGTTSKVSANSSINPVYPTVIIIVVVVVVVVVVVRAGDRPGLSETR